MGRCSAHPERVGRHEAVLVPGRGCIDAIFDHCMHQQHSAQTRHLSRRSRSNGGLQDRSFRAFHPSKDAEKRKGLILDFFGPVGLWAQYAVGKRAIDEWEIGAHEYRIEKHGDISEVTIHLEGAMTQRNLPDECDNCIPTAGVSISIRNLFDSDRITFRVNDPNGILPSPFPIFKSWTRFTEDEYQNGG